MHGIPSESLLDDFGARTVRRKRHVSNRAVILVELSLDSVTNDLAEGEAREKVASSKNPALPGSRSVSASSNRVKCLKADRF